MKSLRPVYSGNCSSLFSISWTQSWCRFCVLYLDIGGWSLGWLLVFDGFKFYSMRQLCNYI